MFTYDPVRSVELSGLSMREIQGDSFNQRFLPTMEYILERQKTVRPLKNIWDIIHRGSYPALQEGDTDWAAFYGDYIRTYIERDVRELSAVQDLEAFRRFMIAAGARTGEVLNYSHLADEIGKDVSTVKNWVSILEASWMIYLLEPYTANVLKRAIRTPKLYFRDTGLVCYLTRWLTAETLACGAFGGHIFETFVISEILKSFSNAGLDYRYFVSYYRGRDRKRVKKNGELTEMESEIDFIIEENGILYPVEIKKSGNVTPDVTGSFLVLDKIEGKKRGTGGSDLHVYPAGGAEREYFADSGVVYLKKLCLCHP